MTPKKISVWCLVLVPLVIQGLVVWRFGVNMLTSWDEYFYVSFVRDLIEGRPWLHWLYPMQHNEHRMVAMKVLLGWLAVPTRWDAIVHMYISVALAGVTALGLWRLYHRAGGTRLLYFAPVVWLLCNVAGHQNMLLSLQTAFYFTALGAVWALACLAGGGLIRVSAAAAFALLASFSTLNGLLIWPAGLLALVGRRASWREVALWLTAACACVWMYFIRYDSPPQVGSPVSAIAQPIQLIVFLIRSLGAPSGAGSLVWSFVAGAVWTLVLVGLARRVWRRRRLLPQQASLVGLVAFGILSLAATAIGRAPFGPEWALASRYVLFSSLALAGTYMLVVVDDVRTTGAWPRPFPGLPGTLVLTVIGLVAGNISGVVGASAWRTVQVREKFLLQTWGTHPQVSPHLSIFGVEELRESAAFLEAHRLGPFSEPVDLLLAIGWDDGRPVGEILPGHPVEQSLVCPVETLSDVAVVFGNYQRANDATIELTLYVDSIEVVHRRLPTSGMRDNGWVSVGLPEPLTYCRGRRLRLRLSSEDSTTGNAVTAWTYPSYYDGDLLAPVAEGRSLAIQLNAAKYRVLD